MGICQIPDFEKKAYGQHINVVDKFFNFYLRGKRIPSSFMKEQLKGLKDHGNVDLLSHDFLMLELGLM